MIACRARVLARQTLIVQDADALCGFLRRRMAFLLRTEGPAIKYGANQVPTLATNLMLVVSGNSGNDEHSACSCHWRESVLAFRQYYVGRDQ